MRSDAPARALRRGKAAGGGAAAWNGEAAEASQVLLGAHVSSVRHAGGPILWIAGPVAMGLVSVNHRRSGPVIFGFHGPRLPPLGTTSNCAVADESARAATMPAGSMSADAACMAAAKHAIAPPRPRPRRVCASRPRGQPLKKKQRQKSVKHTSVCARRMRACILRRIWRGCRNFKAVGRQTLVPINSYSHFRPQSQTSVCNDARTPLFYRVLDLSAPLGIRAQSTATPANAPRARTPPRYISYGHVRTSQPQLMPQPQPSAHHLMHMCSATLAKKGQAHTDPIRRGQQMELHMPTVLITRSHARSLVSGAMSERFSHIVLPIPRCAARRSSHRDRLRRRRCGRTCRHACNHPGLYHGGQVEPKRSFGPACRGMQAEEDEQRCSSDHRARDLHQVVGGGHAFLV